MDSVTTSKGRKLSDPFNCHAGALMALQRKQTCKVYELELSVMAQVVARFDEGGVIDKYYFFDPRSVSTRQLDHG